MEGERGNTTNCSASSYAATKLEEGGTVITAIHDAAHTVASNNDEANLEPGGANSIEQDVLPNPYGTVSIVGGSDPNYPMGRPSREYRSSPRLG